MQRRRKITIKPKGRAAPGGARKAVVPSSLSPSISSSTMPTPVFRTLTSDQDLAAGLYLLRPLGGGNFEFVDLNTVKLTRLGSEDVGREIKALPDRLKLFETVAKDSAMLVSKLNQGYKNANSEIFRFLKLPLELRFRVYESLMSIIHYLPCGLLAESEGPFRPGCFNLRLVCKQTYEESQAIFYRNQFHFLAVPEFTPTINNLAANIRSIYLIWKNERTQMTNLFKWVASFEKLESLELRMHQARRALARKEKLHQDNRDISKFSKLPGFDHLVSIRGLKSVTLKSGWWYHTRDPPTPRENELFGQFLTDVLTQPKEVQQAVKKLAILPKKVKHTRKSNRKSTAITRVVELGEDETYEVDANDQDDDDSDYHP